MKYYKEGEARWVNLKYYKEREARGSIRSFLREGSGGFVN